MASPLHPYPAGADTIADWAAQLRPDFAGRGQGGRFIVLLSAISPFGDFFYSIGYSLNSVSEAHEVAIGYMIQQRFDQEVGLMLDAGMNRAE